MRSMTPRILGKTGFSVSPLGFGSAPVAYLKTDATAAAALLNELLDAGLNVIDTAVSYPGSEAFIGQHLSHRRKDYVLVSKCGAARPEGVTGEKWSASFIAGSVDHSLKDLRTDQLDVMLLHTCDFETLRRGEALGALADAQKAGKVKFIGYSGDNEAATYACGLPEVAVVETSINYADQVNIDQVLPVARQNNVGIIAKRPVANAAWRGQNVGRGGFYDSYASEYVKRHAAMNADTLGIAPDAWAETALRFVLSFPEVSTAVAGTTKRENALKNLEYAARGPLPAEQVQRIRDAFRSAPGSNTWTGQT